MENMTLQTVERAFGILEMIAERQMTLRELEAETGLNRTTLSRLLFTLSKNKYIEKDAATGRYKVGLKVIELGSVMLNQIELKTEALPFLRELTQNVGRVCHMGILSQGEVVYIEKTEPMTSIRMFSGIGKRVPVHSTSLGKALLIDKSEKDILEILNDKGMDKFTQNTIVSPDGFIREMEITKKRGYSFDNAENEEGIFCVAAPIKDYRNEVVAAISTTGRDNSFLDDPQSSIIQAIKETAYQISVKMGYSK
jgi:DNA-binding IclR family transcriptional regulator